MRVRVKAWSGADERAVDLVDAGTNWKGDTIWDVYLDGLAVGTVEKDTYTYSPPTHRGSRIVRYHKQCPCWRASGTGVNFRTRKEAILELLRRVEV